MHRYLRTVTSFQRAANFVKKKCVHATTFRTMCGEKKKTSKEVFGISEAKLLIFDCVNLYSLLRQSRAHFRLIYVLDISNFVSSGDTLINIHTFRVLLLNCQTSALAKLEK